MARIEACNGRYILGPDGEPLPEPDLLAWGRWMEAADRTVARTTVAMGEGGGSRVEVSTVFLGLDHRSASMSAAPPVLWETMIFGGPRDGESWRYFSRAGAIAGHEVACKVALSFTTEDD